MHDDLLALNDWLYEEFVIFLHLAGFSTRIDTVNECGVFNIICPNEFDGRPDYTYTYLGNFKIQGTDILLFPPGYPSDHHVKWLTDLSDPTLYHKILKYFGKSDDEIEYILDENHRCVKHMSKMPETSIDPSRRYTPTVRP